MYQVLLCTCRAIVLLIKAFVLPRRRRRCRRGLLKVPSVEMHLSLYDKSHCRYFARKKYCDDISLARTIYRDGMSHVLRDIGKMSQGSSDISSNYRSEVLLICAIYRRDIGEKSKEQSAIFHDYRLHYFCTILYMHFWIHRPSM